MACASKERRTSTLFLSCASDKGVSSPSSYQLAFLYRVDIMNMMPPGGLRRIDRGLVQQSSVEEGIFYDVRIWMLLTSAPRTPAYPSRGSHP